jgi:hypothetical protein
VCTGLEAELNSVERQIRNIVHAVKTGFFAPTMKKEMATLEARQAKLQTRLADAPDEAPMALHPGLAEISRRKVADLSAALNVPAQRQEAAEALRGLVEAITLWRTAPAPQSAMTLQGVLPMIHERVRSPRWAVPGSSTMAGPS